jgi:hypothetical protein
MKVGAAHCDYAIGLSNPKNFKQFISSFVTCSYAFGIENGFPQNGFEPGTNSKET